MAENFLIHNEAIKVWYDEHRFNKFRSCYNQMKYNSQSNETQYNEQLGFLRHDAHRAPRIFYFHTIKLSYPRFHCNQVTVMPQWNSKPVNRNFCWWQWSGGRVAQFLQTYFSNCMLRDMPARSSASAPRGTLPMFEGHWTI